MSDPALTIAALCEGLEAPEEVLRFDHIPGREVVFAPGCLELVGRKASEAGGRSVLLVTDPGIARAGHPDRARGYLEAEGLDVIIYDQVRENPTTEDVANCLEAAKKGGVDLIVGLGGGSSMDTAKGCNFILTNGGEMKDYWGVGKATEPMLPLIAVPTTSGTGSECQSFALIADAETHQKMACGDKKAAAVVALLDPELTVTQPAAVTANTGIDAVAHAVETAVCRKRTDISLAYSRLAYQLLEGGLERVFRDPGDLRARAQMQLGAAYAGTAIENSMLGAAHSCANPLTARFGIPHGQAVGLMLPHVVAFNRSDSAAEATYSELAGSGEALQARLSDLLEKTGLKGALSDLEVESEAIPAMAEEAAKQWTAQFNPVTAERAEMERLYRSAL